MHQPAFISIPHYRQAKQLAEHIRERVAIGESQGLSIRELSKAFGACESVITKNFRRWQGQSIHAYIIRSKMELATERILNNIDSIKAIAIDLGYTELSNFSRDFKRVTGLSPMAYRRQHFPFGVSECRIIHG